MFGFGGTGFGQPAQQPAPAFGAQPASPFGAAFGQTAQPAATPFGATTGSTPLFGAQSPAPAFGQAAPAAAPGFGAPTNTTGFGTAAFGAAAKPAGFGGFGTTTTAPNPFGGAAQSAPAFGGFGATSAAAFGAPAAAPANPFGAATTGFGAAAAPAFGAAPAATGFGAPAAPAAAPFGSTTTNLFGAPAVAPSPFGAAPTQPTAAFGNFGAAPAGAQTTGTRNVAYTKTKDPDVGAGQPATFLMSMSALPNYQPPAVAKSHEELRWEDYQEGVKNQSAGPAPTAANAFGAPAGAPSGFGGFGAATQPAATGFGAAAANPFGAPTSTSAFGATAAPAFGATASQPSLFGATPAPAAQANPFGAAASAPAFGGFGAAPAAASQPSLFGATTTTGFGATAAPFGTTATPFGGASSAAAFSFTSSPSTFGAASAPATSLFGTAPAAASSPFGATTSTFGAVGSPFGGASSASAFGNSTFGAFGANTAKPATPFGAPTATTPFGATAPATGGGLFGGGSPFNFNSQPASSPSLFGNTAGGSTMSFSTNHYGASAPTPVAGGLFGAAAAPAQAAQAQPPTVAQPAYGNFGALPAVPDAKVGITTRAIRNSSISSGGSKASPLLSLRPTPVRYGASVRTRPDIPSNLGGASAANSVGAVLPAASVVSGTASDLLTPQAPAGAGSSSAAAAAAAAATVGGSGLLPLRQNPHRLFISAPPPSTEAAGGVSFLSPARPTSTHRGTTPDGVAAAANGDDVHYHHHHHHHHHGDGAAAETPAGRHGGPNGFANGYSGGATAAANTGAAGRTAAAAAPAAAFQDGSASEPYLPRLGPLVSQGFSFSPNVDELRLLHSQNPDNLASVSNFTVSCAGVGQIRWVVPVDVRGMALYDIVSIKFGDVSCYPDPATKPPQGQGLNKPAEITFYGVYKRDRETGVQYTEGPRGQAYEKSLRQMCAKMGAKFISYKLDGGVWKFEVEHFSRYGLMDLDDDEEDAAATPAGTATAATRMPPPAAPAPEEGVGEAPGFGPAAGLRRRGLQDNEVASDVARAGAAGAGLPIGQGLAGAGLRGFALRGGGGAPAASAAGRAPAPLLGDESEMEPSVGIRRPQFGVLPEAGGSETTGMAGAGLDQDMSEARAQLRFGDDPAAEAEVSGGVVGPAARGGGGGGSTVTGPLGLVHQQLPDFAADAMDAAAAANTTVPIQHALPASLAHDPVQTRALHEAFFGGGDGGRRVAAEGRFSRDGGVAPPGPGYRQQQQQQQQQRAAAGQEGGAAAGGVPRGRTAAAVNVAGAAGGAVKTTWRRPAAPLAVGAPAAVMSRGAALLSSADGMVEETGGGFGASGSGGFGSGGGGGVSPLPISLALARALDVPSGGIPALDDGTLAAVRPLRDVRTAGCLTDAGLAMGRAFRVGWGPGGKLVVPGAADAASATEICITRVRVEGEEGYGEASYGSVSGGPGSKEADRLEALRDRLKAALEVHLAASRAVVPPQDDADLPPPDDDSATDGSTPALSRGVRQRPVPYWRLCVDSRELAVLVSRYVRVCETQLQHLLTRGGGAGGGGAGGEGAGADGDADQPDVLRLRHEADTWRLVEVLFARIDGEVPGADNSTTTAAPAAAAGTAAAAATPLRRAPGAVSAGSGDDGDVVMTSTPPAVSDKRRMVRDHDMAGASGAAEDDEQPSPPASSDTTSSTTRLHLAALQRRSQLGMWLQRQARRRVREDFRAVGSLSEAVLHLLASHQLAAAAAAAIEAGDPRLAMLITNAGSRASTRAKLASQLAIWKQSGFAEHFAPERLAAYYLMAGQVLETQRLLSLDWRRVLGLNLWYGIPSTASPMAAVQQYLMDRHTESAIVPHPAPYHVEGLQPSATGAATASAASAGSATDVQWELLRLWSATPAAATADVLAAGQEATAAGVAAAAKRARASWLAGGGCSRLLRVSGYSPNPLDHSLAWHLMTVLQASQVLPAVSSITPGSSGASAAPGSPSAADASPAGFAEMLGSTLEFISQLLLAGGLCEWAVYVALTIPDLRDGEEERQGDAGGAGGAAGAAGVRERLVGELLVLTVPEWLGDSAREGFLTATLRIPSELLAEAKATWAQYARDDAARCTALLAAGDAAAAHDIFVASVAPSLFLSGAWSELSRLVEALEPAASGLPSWSTGGALYGNFIAIFGRQLVAAAGAAATAAAAAAASGTVVPEGVTKQDFLAFVAQVQMAQTSLETRGSALAAAAGNTSGILAPSSNGGTSLLSEDGVARARRRLVLGRIASRVRAVCVSAGGPVWEERSAILQSGLALPWCSPSDLALGSVAVAAAEVGSRVVCAP